MFMTFSILGDCGLLLILVEKWGEKTFSRSMTPYYVPETLFICSSKDSTSDIVASTGVII